MCMDKLSVLLASMIIRGMELQLRGNFEWDCLICRIDYGWGWKLAKWDEL
jgi:hypothetical protein